MSWHCGLPVAHDWTPVWHLLAGWQSARSRQSTQAPSRHTRPAPQGVPPGASPDSWHRETPVAQEVTPSLQALPGEHDTPAAHGTQLPPLQTRPSPQLRPSGSETSVSSQRGLTPVQDRAPLWQGLVGAQAAPAAHGTQLPPLQTRPSPQLAPPGASPEATQTGAPVRQLVCPVLQGSAGVQVAPSTQATHAPLALQTMPVPHDAPADRTLPVSLHRGAPPVHSSAPSWQGFAGTHAAPVAHAAQSPPRQTMPDPHALPFGALSPDTQLGVPLAQSIVPRRQGSPVIAHAAPRSHALQAPS